ncbi:GlxA family transcriptional regulator [Parathalassolituus penaei]|uniref:Helix-turn-helix domain-containing protein n=1 Tax=Parathalassolituus penaei TaxID=2997323 RepID=A0A9X3EBJ7_9GAMM|nr:helix-turn-helix domain-containing protein [Parathalassolituus penaei]MCY0964533.1 helix-turn-helix domain-containing protein [Parathalassolituus penaei]
MLQHVTVLVLEQMLSSSVAIPMEMAEALRARLRASHRDDADFVIQLAAVREGEVTALGGLRLQPDCLLSDISHTSLVVVPALWRNPRRTLARNAEAIHWLARQYRLGASVIAVGTGVCLLAEAGILDGKPATTHWHYQDQFARDYPAVQLQRRHLLTQAGRIYCAASVNSGADMVIHLIGQMYGRELALQVEQQFSPEVRNPFEKQVYSAETSARHPDEEIALAQAWMQQNLREPVTLAQLAQRSGLSERQFSRRFRQSCGVAPIEYLHGLRCNAARELLQHSNLSVADIAASVGFSDSSYFIRIFRRLAGQTPGAYRDKVRGKLFTSS